MKKLLLPAFLFFVASSVKAQQQSICTQQFSDIAIPAGTGVVNGAAAKDIVQDIMNVTGLSSGFTIEAADVSNAVAVIYNGKRYVLYNPAFIYKLNHVTGNDWASVSVLAHEIGHHLNGHTLNNDGSQPGKELEADEFSGYIMQRLGATLEEAEMAMNLAADIKGSSTHPGRNTRIAAIEKGWNRASDQLTADIEENEKPDQVKKEPAPLTASTDNKATQATAARQTVLEEKYIAADISFDKDKTTPYFITTHSSVVAIKEDELFVIGTVKENNSKDYPFIIETGNDILYIGKGGVIFNNNGNRVGIITEHTL